MRCRIIFADCLLGSGPFLALVWDRECNQSKDKWEKLSGPPRQWVQVNTITPRYMKEHSLQVGPITDLMGSKVTCVGLGNAYTRPLGYVVIGVQVDRVRGYNEDQIALIILDFSNFAARVPIILWTPTIG